MIALDKNQRPNCEQVLAKKESWFMSPLDSSLKSFVHQFLALNSVEKSFSQHFIQQKFKYCYNIFD
jgi:hypothetical protein